MRPRGSRPRGRQISNDLQARARRPCGARDPSASGLQAERACSVVPLVALACSRLIRPVHDGCMLHSTNFVAPLFVSDSNVGAPCRPRRCPISLASRRCICVVVYNPFRGSCCAAPEIGAYAFDFSFSLRLPIISIHSNYPSPIARITSKIFIFNGVWRHVAGGPPPVLSACRAGTEPNAAPKCYDPDETWEVDMERLAAPIVLASLLVLGLSGGPAAAEPPEGQLTIAFDASIAPTFLDPAETPGIGTPFVFLYALHDALIKPLPGNDMAPCVAESWKESPDGLVYEFKLREGLRFHNGDPVTAEDVKFSFHRYRGASAKLLHERVKAVDIVDPHRIRFLLHAPWPDFMAFYASPATGAAWVVPKKYIEKVGEDGFRQHPVGLGPYRFSRMEAGISLVLEANEQYWRKKPAIKTIVIKGVPDRTTRLAMLKTGEADIGYPLVGVAAAAIKDDPKLQLAQVIAPATWWVDYPDQWNPKSPWHDRRVRLAANLAVDKHGVNEAERLGYSRLTGSIIPSGMEFALKFEPYPDDAAKAKRLLAEAGYPNGFDAGNLTPLPPFTTMGEAVANDLAAVGIRTRVRTLERASNADR